MTSIYKDYEFYQIRLTSNLDSLSVSESDLNVSNLTVSMNSEPEPLCKKLNSTSSSTVKDFTVSIPDIELINTFVDKCTNSVYFDLMLKSSVEGTKNQYSSDSLVSSGSSSGSSSDIDSDQIDSLIQEVETDHDTVESSFNSLESYYNSNIATVVDTLATSFNQTKTTIDSLNSEWDSQMAIVKKYSVSVTDAVKVTNELILSVSNALSQLYQFNSAWLLVDDNFSITILNAFNELIERNIVSVNSLRTSLTNLIFNLINSSDSNNNNSSDSDYEELVEKYNLDKEFTIYTLDNTVVLSANVNLLKEQIVSTTVKHNDHVFKISRVPQRVLNKDGGIKATTESGREILIDSDELSTYGNVKVRNVVPDSLRIILPSCNKLSKLFPSVTGYTLNALEDTLQQIVKVSSVASFNRASSFPALLTLDSDNRTLALDISAAIVEKYSSGGLFNNFDKLLDSSTFMDELVKLGKLRVTGINKCTTVSLYDFLISPDSFDNLVVTEFCNSIKTFISPVYDSSVDHGFKVISYENFKSIFFKS